METNGINRESKTPLLMISHGESVEKHLIYNPSEKSVRMLNNVSVLNGKKVLGSFYGWLVLVKPADVDGDCCLFNPITEEKIELPKLDDSRTYSQCILTKPPTEPDCYILFNGLEQSFCRIGDGEYVTRTLEQQEVEEQENGRVGFDDLRTISSFQGTTYGFMDPDKFVTIHFVGNTIEFRQIPMVEPSVIPHSSRAYDIWLIESCDGELLVVQRIHPFTKSCYDGMDFTVFRFDTNRMSYAEIENIGNRTIFVSRNGAGYCCASQETKPNSIYYTNEDDRNFNMNHDRNLHVFDLENRSTHSMLPSSKVATNKLITTCWVQPEIFHGP
ncbi:hypothetical protein ABFS82_03G089400 [Erythranthe guttata]|uniref:KIB1-4 beta-propeller domain-containing protein n=1 Tax=Erythranthe guttata TaxID=4155 RepID=A0A022PMV5_ERYGU|nr:hypothetical protein MIMGU_mgv1a021858mg [Erythranthe guttata]